MTDEGFHDLPPLVFDGPPVVVETDVIAIPDTVKRRPARCGMFRADGTEITLSRCWKSGTEPGTLPPEAPDLTTRADLAGTHLFGGLLSGHFGHVLCVATARLWALEDHGAGVQSLVFFARDPAKAAVFAQRARPVLASLGVVLPITMITEPTRIGRLVLARQGFGVEDLLVGSPAFRAFVRSKMGAPEALPGDGRMVYVSRELQPNRRGYTIGELALQARLAEAGVQVFHPERHDMAAQCAVYRGASCIIGSDGSALHVASFAAPRGCKIVVLQRRPGPALAQLGCSLAAFVGRPPDLVSADRLWTGEKGRVAVSYASVAFPDVGRAIGLDLAERPGEDVDAEVSALATELGVALREAGPDRARLPQPILSSSTADSRPSRPARSS